jgi:beta-N-acetylhexosaminidase
MSISRVESLGQLLMIGLGEDRWSGAEERLLRRLCPGGILLSARHLRRREFTPEFLRKLWLALPAPPFLALEEEGGAVDPLEAFLPPLPAPFVAAQKGVSATRRLGELAGAGLRLLGFNTNLAPRLDLSTFSSKNSLSTRAFSSDPHEMARCGAAFVEGLEQHRVLPCAKYFLGGASATQGRGKPPVIGKTMAALWRADLIPYRTLLPRLPLVLVSRGAYKAFDYDLPRPASLSENVLEGLLRLKLAYRGVAVADDLDAVVGSRPACLSGPSRDLGEAAVRSVKAGCDLLLLGGGRKSAQQALAALNKAIETGTLSTCRTEQALARLRFAKKGLVPPTGKISHRTLLELARQFEDFSEKCRSPEQKIA